MISRSATQLFSAKLHYGDKTASEQRGIGNCEYQIRPWPESTPLGRQTPSAQLLHPALTTVRRSEQAMGRYAAELLIARLDGPDANRPGRGFELPFQLVLRDSA